MKKFFIVFVFVVCVVTLVFPLKSKKTQTEYLRIHVRANSNDTSDQNIKYVVKDAVVAYLSPYVSNCTTKSQAYCVLQSKLKDIDDVCKKTLVQNGFFYGAKAYLRSENFPARTYGSLTLSEGIYDALIVELGTGKGDNWWCVVYPPLCFAGGKSTDTNTVTFKSYFYELFFGK